MHKYIVVIFLVVGYAAHAQSLEEFHAAYEVEIGKCQKILEEDENMSFDLDKLQTVNHSAWSLLGRLEKLSPSVLDSTYSDWKKQVVLLEDLVALTEYGSSAYCPKRINALVEKMGGSIDTLQEVQGLMLVGASIGHYVFYYAFGDRKGKYQARIVFFSGETSSLRFNIGLTGELDFLFTSKKEATFKISPITVKEKTEVGISTRNCL